MSEAVVSRTRFSRSSIAAVALVLTAAAPVRAQLVRGVVLEEGTLRPLDGVSIELLDSIGERRARAVSDTAGAFRLLAPLPGEYRLRAARIGYATLETPPLAASIGVGLELELKLSPTAVALDPVRVMARSPYAMGRLQEYYERAIRTRQTGIGRVLTRDDLERVQLPNVSAALVHLQPRAGCTPSLFLDGMEVPDARELDARLNPRDLEGVEFYNNASQLPRAYDCCGRCAVVLYWTRRDIEDPRPPSFRRLLLAAGLIAVVALVALRM